MNILLVEDDAVIADAICVYLGNSLIQVTHASTISVAKHYLTTCQFDMCLLDIALPDGSGTSLIKFARKLYQGLPVILLTAKDALDDKIHGLNTGADDYITKPFDFEELIARINSIYRRSTRQFDSYLRHGNLHYDLANKVVKLSDKRLTLSSSELRLLVAFLSNPNRVLSESQLKDYLYGVNEDVSSNALNVHLFNLRKKIGKNIIVTERGLGFRLASVEEQNQ